MACEVEGLPVRGPTAGAAEIVLGSGEAHLARDSLAVWVESKETLHVLVRAGQE
jgi:hypothetical protein